MALTSALLQSRTEPLRCILRRQLQDGARTTSSFISLFYTIHTTVVCRTCMNSYINDRPHFGILLGDLSNRFDSNVFWSAYNSLAAQNADITTIYTSLINDDQDEAMCSVLLEEMVDFTQFDGLIILAGTLSHLYSRDRLAALLYQHGQLNVVSISIPVGDFPTIQFDNYAGMRTLLSHLIHESGAQKVAFVAGKQSHLESNERLRAYRDSVEEHALPVDNDWIAFGAFTEQSGECAVEQLISEKKLHPDAIACANDEMAFGVLRKLMQMGHRIPEDILVTGFDDVPLAEYLPVPLTTVRQASSEVGRCAADMLISLHNGVRIERQPPPPTLVRRASSGIAYSPSSTEKSPPAQSRLDLQRRNDQIHDRKLLDEAGRKLAYCVTPHKLAEGLADFAKRFGINEAHIYIYDSSDAPTAMRPLVCYFESNWHVFEQPAWRDISALYTASAPVHAENKLVMPLHFTDDFVGCLEVAIGPHHSHVYEALRSHIASAIRNLVITQQLKAHNDLLEQQVAERTDQLFQMLEQKQEMLGIVAHDLRNPLTIIGISLDMLTLHRQKLSEEAVVRQLSRIRQAADGMLTHIARLLNEQQHSETGLVTKMARTELLPIIRAVVAQEQVHAEAKGICIATVCEDGHLTANVDGELLAMALSNIVNNAVKYTPAGRRVTVTLGRSAGLVQIAVLDEGKGITEADKEKMFGRFVRLSALPTAGEVSSGFGLYVVKKMVEAMDGIVSAEARQDSAGSIFTLSFPYAK